jgi:hypothetical protein
MKFYAYLPDENGQEPFGTFNRLMFELKTIQGAIRRCNRIFKSKVPNGKYKLFRYTNFYDEKTFHEIIRRCWSNL